MSERTPYESPEWKACRPRVLERDNYRCQLALPKCKGHATHVDHRIDWRDGGDWFALSNLQASCSSCNVAKRNTGVAARARAHRNGTTVVDEGDVIVLTALSWLTPAEKAHYGPLPPPGQSRRVPRWRP